MDGETQSEALLNFLQSPDFKSSLDVFFSSHRRFFSHGSRDRDSHSHRQYSVWKDYQQLVEGLIDSALTSIGGSVESLELGLEEICRREPSGPKQAMVQELVVKLLSYHR